MVPQTVSRGHSRSSGLEWPQYHIHIRVTIYLSLSSLSKKTGFEICFVSLPSERSSSWSAVPYLGSSASSRQACHGSWGGWGHRTGCRSSRACRGCRTGAGWGGRTQARGHWVGAPCSQGGIPLMWAACSHYLCFPSHPPWEQSPYSDSFPPSVCGPAPLSTAHPLTWCPSTWQDRHTSTSGALLPATITEWRECCTDKKERFQLQGPSRNTRAEQIIPDTWGTAGSGPLLTFAQNQLWSLLLKYLSPPPNKRI